jgi:hypothetical protein
LIANLADQPLRAQEVAVGALLGAEGPEGMVSRGAWLRAMGHSQPPEQAAAGTAEGAAVAEGGGDGATSPTAPLGDGDGDGGAAAPAVSAGGVVGACTRAAAGARRAGDADAPIIKIDYQDWLSRLTIKIDYQA